MRLDIDATLRVTAANRTGLMLAIMAARNDDQTVITENLQGPEGVEEIRSPDGCRLYRFTGEGDLELRYTAQVDNGDRPSFDDDTPRTPFDDLPVACLEYLAPSRFCPSDRFERFAKREFGHVEGGGRQAGAVVEWIRKNVDYLAGFSNATTTAEQTFVDRAGVCRDFAHLGVTFFRALGLPARCVSAYAWRLDPPDFHAVIEVFLDNRWWLADPTGLAPVSGLVRIATGRDAADVAFLTTDEEINFGSLSVKVDRAEA